MKPTILLSTIPSDSHSWNLVFMDLFLRELGFGVLNLGPCSSVDLIADKLATGNYCLLVVSTVNGHGKIEAPSIKNILRERNINLPAVIGGKLDIGVNPRTDGDCLTLLDAGFDAVFEDSSNLVYDDFQRYLRPFLVPNQSYRCKRVNPRNNSAPRLGQSIKILAVQ